MLSVIIYLITSSFPFSLFSSLLRPTRRQVLLQLARAAGGAGTPDLSLQCSALVDSLKGAVAATAMADLAHHHQSSSASALFSEALTCLLDNDGRVRFANATPTPGRSLESGSEAEAGPGQEAADPDKQLARTAGAAAPGELYWDFLSKLLVVRPSGRASVQAVAEHAFLTGRDWQGASSLSPLSLHSQDAVTLPALHSGPLGGDGQGGAEEGADGSGDAWQRRQYSRIWAPMPADYSTDTSGSSPAAAEQVPVRDFGPLSQSASQSKSPGQAEEWMRECSSDADSAFVNSLRGIAESDQERGSAFSPSALSP